jgi:hypothetical protein
MTMNGDGGALGSSAASSFLRAVAAARLIFPAFGPLSGLRCGVRQAMIHLMLAG